MIYLSFFPLLRIYGCFSSLFSFEWRKNVMVIYTGCPDQIVQNLKTIILQEKSFDCLLFYYKLIVYVCYHSRIDFSHLKNIIMEKSLMPCRHELTLIVLGGKSNLIVLGGGQICPKQDCQAYSNHINKW